MIGRSLVETVVREVTDGWDMENVAVAQWIDERGRGEGAAAESKRLSERRTTA